jgi:hypothetical protein
MATNPSERANIVYFEVKPEKIYSPDSCLLTWFHLFGLKCGNCERDFQRWAWFGKPRCPYCGVRNVPEYFCQFF